MCGRGLLDYEIYDENDPIVKSLLHDKTSENDIYHGDACKDNSGSPKTSYYMKLNNDKVIFIPEEGCIVGRTETGAEELADCPSVSRQHLRVTPKRRIGVLIEDISKYGTLVDGKRIEKNTPVRVMSGSKITLCNVETTLMYGEEDKNETC
jgi:pSer/pThr/pTyr-binding forkhead associated (FHA) protein